MRKLIWIIINTSYSLNWFKYFVNLWVKQIKNAERLIILTNWCFYVTLLYKSPEIRSLERTLTCKMTLINMQLWERYRSWWNPTEAAQEMFHLSLSHCIVLNASSLPSLHLCTPPCAISSLNGFRPGSSHYCDEVLWKADPKMHSLPATPSQFQFAYRDNRNATNPFLYAPLTHWEHQWMYRIMLFVDLSSALHTTISGKLVTNLLNLGVSEHIFKDFLTNQPQTVRLRIQHSTTLTPSTGVPQGCMFSPFL